MMFELNTPEMSAEIASLMSRYDALPNHIARKHAQAAVKRVMRGAIPTLKRNTPKFRNRVIFGRKTVDGEYTARKVKGGSLRRSVTALSRYLRAKGGGATIYGAVGYSTKQTGPEAPTPGISNSRKAIWLEFGTDRAFARGMVQMTMRQIGKPSATKLASELGKALEKAAAELASKKNPGMSRRGMAAGL